MRRATPSKPSGLSLKDGVASLAVAGSTNVALRLSEPLRLVLQDVEETVHEVRFYADDPGVRSQLQRGRWRLLRPATTDARRRDTAFQPAKREHIEPFADLALKHDCAHLWKGQSTYAEASTLYATLAGQRRGPRTWNGGVGFTTATTETVPDAVAVMDPFHVVALAGDALDRCRQRVQQATSSAGRTTRRSTSPTRRRSTPQARRATPTTRRWTRCQPDATGRGRSGSPGPPGPRRMVERVDGWSERDAPRNRAWSQSPARSGGGGWTEGPQQGTPQQQSPHQQAPRQQVPHQQWDRHGLDPTQYAPRQQPQPYREDQGGAGPGGPSRTRRPRRRRRFGWGKRIGVVLLVLLLLVVGFIIYLDRSLNRVDALSGYAGRVGATPGTNWLLVGSDSRAGLSNDQESELSTGSAQDAGGQRTDTIMMLHIPSGSGASTLISIPRDSYLPIPGNGTDKVNAAFAIGGPSLLVQTLEEATKVHIDHYAEVGFGGFADVVDAVGGVDLCLQQAIDDPLAGINLAPGCQTLSGPEALGYVRTRETFANADLTRVQNQRAFLTALLNKSTSFSTLVNPFRLLPLATSATSSLTVDSSDHIWNLAGLGWAMRGTLVTTTVPVGGFEDTSSGNALLWDNARAAQFFGAIAEDKQLPADLITTG